MPPWSNSRQCGLPFKTTCCTKASLYHLEQGAGLNVQDGGLICEPMPATGSCSLAVRHRPDICLTQGTASCSASDIGQQTDNMQHMGAGPWLHSKPLPSQQHVTNQASGLHRCSGIEWFSSLTPLRGLWCQSIWPDAPRYM